MNANELILNTYTEDKIAVWAKDHWVKFTVVGNRTYHKDKLKDYWTVYNHETRQDHKLNCSKGQELFNKEVLKLL